MTVILDNKPRRNMTIGKLIIEASSTKRAR